MLFKVVALLAFLAVAEGGRHGGKGGCRGNSDGNWKPPGHGDPKPGGGPKPPKDEPKDGPKDGPPKDPPPPLSEDKAAWIEAHANTLFEAFSEHAAFYPEWTAKWGLELDPRERLGLAFRLVHMVGRQLQSDSERHAMAHTVWELSAFAHTDELIAKWDEGEGDAKVRMRIAFYAMRGGDFKKLHDDEEKKGGLYEADLDGAKGEWEEQGYDGPETIEATRLYVACVNAKEKPEECKTQLNWVSSCLECEAAQASSPPPPQWIWCLVGSAGLLGAAVLIFAGYAIGRRHTIRKATMASPVAPAPEAVVAGYDVAADKAIAAKLQAMEA